MKSFYSSNIFVKKPPGQIKKYKTSRDGDRCAFVNKEKPLSFFTPTVATKKLQVFRHEF